MTVPVSSLPNAGAADAPEPPHLAWVSPYDPAAPRGGWQEAHTHLLDALHRQAPNIRVIAPITTSVDRVGRIASRLNTVLTGKRLVWSHSNRRLRGYAAAFAQSAAPLPNGYLFFGSAEFLATAPAQPYFCYTDSAFAPFLETYHRHRRYRRGELVRLSELEREWMRRASGVFTSSAFARRAILAAYGLDPQRVAVAGIGANLPRPAAPTDHNRRRAVLTITTDFQRKGGRLAVDAVRLARRAMPDLTLTVIGECPAPVAREPFVNALGWLDRRTADGQAGFERAMREHAAFLLLSGADLTPIAIAEAAAYGLPTIATRVGGIPEMVRDGKSGWLLAPGADADAIAHIVLQAVGDPDEAATRGGEARRGYEQTWNWDHVAHCVLEGIARLVAQPS
jgi:starch synthase